MCLCVFQFFSCNWFLLWYQSDQRRCFSGTQSLLILQPDYGDSSFWHWCPRLGNLAWGWVPSLQKGASGAKVSLLILNLYTMGVRPAHSASPILLPVSTWLLLYVPSYSNTVQLVFRWFSMMAVLPLSCNCDVVMGGGKHIIHLVQKSWPIHLIQCSILWVFF